MDAWPSCSVLPEGCHGCRKKRYSSFRNRLETVMKLNALVLALLVVLGLSVAQAADVRRISLEGKECVPAPTAEAGKDGIDRIHRVETPALELFPTAQKPARGTIMLCPGGGYSILAINHEGYFVARKLNEFGYDVVILLYHVNAGKETRESAIADAKVALALLLTRGGEFGLSTRKIGVMGFSAGGHLAARLTHVTAAGAPPDFAVLMYPAYLEKGGKVLDEVAPVKTPAFIYVAADDPYAPSAVAYAKACKETNVLCDFTRREHGGHGFGLKPVLPPDVKDWPIRLHAFLDGLK
jgi:acetyl esterase/lipase